MNTEYIYFVISGFVLLLLPLFFIAGVWLRGFFTPFLKVKASAGRLVLVRVRSQLRDYFKSGEVIDGTLKFKSANGHSRTLNIPDYPVFYKAYNVTCIDVDEKKNAIFMLDAKAISGYDAEKYDDLILRALLKPALNNKKLIIIIALLALLIVLAFAIIGLQFQTYKIVGAGTSAVGQIGGFA